MKAEINVTVTIDIDDHDPDQCGDCSALYELSPANEMRCGIFNTMVKDMTQHGSKYKRCPQCKTATA